MRRLKNFSSTNNSSASGVPNDIVKKYGGMCEDQLVEELMKKVREQKQNGSYDEAQMQNFVKIISPHLSDEQRKKLMSLIGAINKE